MIAAIRVDQISLNYDQQNRAFQPNAVVVSYYGLEDSTIDDSRDLPKRNRGDKSNSLLLQSDLVSRIGNLPRPVGHVWFYMLIG